jgi:hypothetical protein
LSKRIYLDLLIIIQHRFEAVAGEYRNCMKPPTLAESPIFISVALRFIRSCCGTVVVRPLLTSLAVYFLAII